MQRTRIKICGVTRAQDAALARDLGADAVGMIFHPPSRRNVSIEEGRRIVGSIGPFVTPVGVFVDAPTPQMVEIAQRVGLRLIQLHGREAPGQALELAAMGLRVTKAMKVDESLPAQVAMWRNALPMLDGTLVGLVLETAGVVPGGSGVANNFGLIQQYQQQGLFAGMPPIIIAGGLTPPAVAEVILSLRPHGVDVSTGVEGEMPGHKSPDKLRAFISEVVRADDLTSTPAAP
jgi:phosphoribosylanthranilate isomerase